MSTPDWAILFWGGACPGAAPARRGPEAFPREEKPAVEEKTVDKSGRREYNFPVMMYGVSNGVRRCGGGSTDPGPYRGRLFLFPGVPRSFPLHVSGKISTKGGWVRPKVPQWNGKRF